MKNIYLNCVYKRNLGDDIFIKIICERYNDCNFLIPNYRKAEIIPKINNLKNYNINQNLYETLGKCTYRLNCRNPIDTFLIRKCDYIVTIGGSIFMESKNLKKYKDFYWYKNLDKKYFILGANIGPVYTKEYIDNIKKYILKNAAGICFRDNKSLEYIKEDCKNAKCYPDIVFSLDIEEFKQVKKKKKVIFSIIDIKSKSKQMKNPKIEEYEQLISNLIQKFHSEKYEILVMSFCEIEGDNIYVKRLKEKYTYIKEYYYDGNIDKALKEISESEVIVGTRFHANVLGFIFNKIVIPIIYNDKTKNLLNDINFQGTFFDINNLNKNSFDNISIETIKRKNKILDIDYLKKEATHHFDELDKVLKNDNDIKFKE